MPRRSILSTSERDGLLALPDTQDELIRHYTFNDNDLALIRQRCGDANRLGFAVQMSRRSWFRRPCAWARLRCRPPTLDWPGAV